VYEKYFGLRQKPFNSTPDPAFQYTNRAYQEAYATLLYGIEERKGFIALTGEVGTGKTTLLRRLMDNMNPALKTVFAYNSTLTFEELVEYICSELQIPVTGLSRVARLQALNKFLIAEAKSGGTVVLLLDEAQNLTNEALENLRLISNLETATAKLLQIVLVGQPELEDKLADPSLRQVAQRIAVRFRLDPLDDAEVEPYIDYRLRVVGRARRDLFTDDAIQTLIPYVRGIPRLINVFCDNALVLAYATDHQRVTGQMIDGVAADLRLTPRGSTAPRSVVTVETPERRTVPSPVGATPTTGGRRWAVTGFAAGVALTLLGVLAVATGNRLDGGARGFLSDRVAGWRDTIIGGRPPAPDPSPEPPTQAAPVPPARQAAAAATPEPGPATTAPAATPVTDPRVPSAGGSASGERAGRSPGPARVTARSLTVPAGGTISRIVFDHYGRHSSLALDLIHELNPELQDLDVVAAGQTLRLPPLNMEGLLRRQPDGSYRLVVGSYPSQAAATELARTIREHGYTASVRTREVTSGQVLHRVQIDGLATRAVALRAWETANRLEWLDVRRDGPDRAAPGRSRPSARR
jgi:general secretion pathway protein A